MDGMYVFIPSANSEKTVIIATHCHSDGCRRCGNCGKGGHDTVHCPRPVKAAAAKGAAAAKPAAVAKPFRNASAKGVDEGSAPQSKGSGKGGKGAPKHAKASMPTAAPRYSTCKAKPAEAVEQGVMPAVKHTPAVGTVLVVAEKVLASSDDPRCRLKLVLQPSVAKAIASLLSGGRRREYCNPQGWAPMCHIHE